MHFHQFQMINFQHFLILFLISQLASNGIKAQSNIDQPAPPHSIHKSLNVRLILFVAFLSLFMLIAFILYIYHCANTCKNGTIRNTDTNAIMLRTTFKGTNRENFSAFPIIAYSKFKDLKMGKAELECAVCLNEFKEQDNLRLLPKCDHVFHRDCIDAWLACHETCPVCRAKQKPCQDEAAIAIPIEEESSITRPG